MPSIRLHIARELKHKKGKGHAKGGEKTKEVVSQAFAHSLQPAMISYDRRTPAGIRLASWREALNALELKTFKDKTVRGDADLTEMAKRKNLMRFHLRLIAPGTSKKREYRCHPTSSGRVTVTVTVRWDYFHTKKAGGEPVCLMMTVQDVFFLFIESKKEERKPGGESYLKRPESEERLRRCQVSNILGNYKNITQKFKSYKRSSRLLRDGMVDTNGMGGVGERNRGDSSSTPRSFFTRHTYITNTQLSCRTP